MKRAERTCSDCAEIIKAKATVCKHCGRKYSQADMQREKEANLDEALKSASPKIRSGRKFKGCRVEQHMLSDRTEKFGVSLSELVAHAKKRGMIVDTNPELLSLQDHENIEIRKQVVSELKLKSKEGVITYEVITEIAKTNNLYRHSVEGSLTAAKISFIDYKGDLIGKDARKRIQADRVGQDRKFAKGAPIPSVDNQYGVLQGAANVVGGCTTMWGYAILLFIVAAIISLISSIFS